MQRVKEINQITEDGLLLSDGTVVEFDDIQLPFGGSLVKAVRCWACENYSQEGTCDILCGVKMKKDDFCSYGRLAE